MTNASEIASFYSGRSILITGATGFMGKVLVEKLLRACPLIKNLYLLIRPKGGSDVKARVEDLISTRIFDNLKRDHPEALLKLIPISGDIIKPGLGISEHDENILIENVSVVLHSAATVKFDEALKLSIAMNINGTKQLLKLCHKMSNLVALVHVSTAYCNCDREKIDEVVYPNPTDPHRLIECVDWMTDDMAETITPQILGNKPNTYTYTKALAEQILMEESGKLPVAIVRPSIVTASWKEPIPGWVDNINGPTGLIAACGKGVLRTILCHRTKKADFVPVDVPINLLIAVAWYTATTRPNSLVVYNCTSGALNTFLWGDLEHYGFLALLQNPLNDIFWYPSLTFRSNRLKNHIVNYLFQYLPAHLLDYVARMCGQKVIMVKIYNKMMRAIESLEYFTTREWEFTNDNLLMLWESLSPEDQAIFNFDLRKLDWPQYISNYCMGIRKYVLKESPETLEHARMHIRRLYIINRMSQLLLLLLFWRTLMVRSKAARRLWYLLFGTVLSVCRNITSKKL